MEKCIQSHFKYIINTRQRQNCKEMFAVLSFFCANSTKNGHKIRVFDRLILTEFDGIIRLTKGTVNEQLKRQRRTFAEWRRI